jgi:hypothetical protein
MTHAAQLQAKPEKISRQVRSPALSRVRHTCAEFFASTSPTNVDRTHVAFDQDSPATRLVLPHGRGKIIALPRVGGLHHRYARSAA